MERKQSTVYIVEDSPDVRDALVDLLADVEEIDQRVAHVGGVLDDVNGALLAFHDRHFARRIAPGASVQRPSTTSRALMEALGNHYGALGIFLTAVFGA